MHRRGVWVGTLFSFFVSACGGGESTSDTTTNSDPEPPNAGAPGADSDSTAPDSTAPDSTAPDSTAPDSTAPDATAPDATAPDATAPDATAPDATDTTSARPDGAGGNSPPSANPTGTVAEQRPAAVFEAGAPEVLIDDMAFPARFTIDGDTAYVINRASYLGNGSADQMIALTLSTGATRVLFEHSGLDEMSLVGDLLWVANEDTGVFHAHDKNTGAELESLDPTPNVALRVIAATNDTFFVTRPPSQSSGPGGYSSIWHSDNGGELTLIWQNEEPEIPNLVRLKPEALFAIVDGADASTLAPTSRLMRMARDGSEAHIIAERELVVDYDWSDSDLIWTDYLGGGVERVPERGGASQLIAAVDAPWGVAVDGDFAYVTTQPEFWCVDAPVGGLLRVDLQSGAVTTLAEGLPCPSRVAVAGDALYWTNNGFVEPADHVAMVGDGQDEGPPRPYRSYGGGAFMRLQR